MPDPIVGVAERLGGHAGLVCAIVREAVRDLRAREPQAVGVRRRERTKRWRRHRRRAEAYFYGPLFVQHCLFLGLEPSSVRTRALSSGGQGVGSGD